MKKIFVIVAVFLSTHFVFAREVPIPGRYAGTTLYFDDQGNLTGFEIHCKGKRGECYTITIDDFPTHIAIPQPGGGVPIVCKGGVSHYIIKSIENSNPEESDTFVQIKLK